MHNTNVSGNDISNSNGSVSYSVGQVFFSYIENDSNYLGEGVQQAYAKDDTSNNDTSNDDTSNDDTSNDSDTDNVDNINNEDIDEVPNDINAPEIDLLVYPNPTSDIINLMSKGLVFSNNTHSYQLYDSQGKLLANNILRLQETQIDLTQLSTSIYILQVYVEEKLWKTFKIFKE